MNCPECKALIEEKHISLTINDESDFIDITIEHDCGKEFFSRIHEDDLILCD